MQFLTNSQRDSIDTEAKATWRDINSAITRLSQAEKVRQQTEHALVQKRRRAKGFGSLASWAAGGAAAQKSPQEEDEDGQMRTLAGSREGVIWYLQRGLEECGRIQSNMMEVRISREIGKNTLKDTVGGLSGIPPGMDALRPTANRSGQANGYHTGTAILEDDETKGGIEQQLSPEQMQLFAQENRDLLKHYEDMLDQVR